MKMSNNKRAKKGLEVWTLHKCKVDSFLILDFDFGNMGGFGGE
jgi:hypothetical protein